MILSQFNVKSKLINSNHIDYDNNDDDSNDDDLIIGMGNAHRQGSQGTKNPDGKNYHL